MSIFPSREFVEQFFDLLEKLKQQLIPVFSLYYLTSQWKIEMRL